MSLFLKRNHYDVLGVGPNASHAEIADAYEKARGLFSDSEAAYSLYTDEERRSRLAALEAAFETLSDRDRRREYDESLAGAAQEDGTYEVDLGYIFSGGPNGAPPEPPAARRQDYRKAPFIRTIAARDRAEAVASEQFKLLCSKLEQAGRKSGHRVIAFTSAIKGEGKSTVTLNTAYMLAATFGKSVAFVECDLRKPSSLLETVSADGPGLSQVIRGEARLDDAISSVEDSGLHVVPAGEYDKAAADIIGAGAAAEVIGELRRRFEFVLLDCPPVIPLADMSIIEKLVDGIVLVVRAGSTSRQLVMSATESLDKKKFIGAVLNGAETRLEKYYY